MKNTLIYLLLLLPVFAFGQTNNQLYDGYRKAIEKGNYKKAEKELKKISMEENDNFIKLLTFGHFYSEKGDLDSAKRYLGAALDYFAGAPISFSDPNFKSQKDSLYTIAIGIYDYIIEEEPIGENYRGRGIFKLDVGRLNDAVIDFNKSIELEPKDYSTHYNLGINYSRLNMPDSALAHYDLAIEYNPKDGESYLNKGFIYLKIDSIALAIPQFEKALTLVTGTKDISYIKNNLGFCYYKQGKLNSAMWWIKESLKMNPLNSFAHKNLALVHIANKDFRAACESIDKAIELGFIDQFGNEILDMKKKHCVD